ncbi:MAG TPA: efflux RND transporter periplasmic adaptor subunit [Bryobacteraceae bacterium]|jgi:cobalt-zinc-cadmium efflux system membrane fusion protein|nr:efflux RND transporter periplasmic adaptor subunit [Bryobacteraceae bacterium]
MTPLGFRIAVSCTFLSAVFLAGCGAKAKVDEATAAPPTANVQVVPDLNLIKVDQPERFSLITAAEQREPLQVNANGVVSPDIERSIPVISLAAGRVVQISAKLGDTVTKGQLLLKVLSNDISAALQNYRQAQADELLARKQLERADLLYHHGAISLNDLDVAQDAEAKSKVAVETAMQQLKTMGADPNQTDSIVNIYAPVSGTIVEQNVVQSAGVHTPDNQPSLFTIADLSRIWILCDVYENDLPAVRLGDSTDIHLNAYPDLIFHGRVSNIGQVLDPNLRTAKVRIELANPGMMRAGMFVTATFYGQHGQQHAVVPAEAILHLHDRDWVFVPAGRGQFRRTEVHTGKVVKNGQEILAGISPGQQVVNNALALESESEQ